MITPVNVLLIIIFLVLVPFSLGLLFEHFIESGESLMFSRCFAMGLAVMLTLFQIVAVPMIHIGTSFDTLLYVYTALLVISIAISLIMVRKNLINCIKSAISNIKCSISKLDRMHIIVGIIAIALIAFQTSLLIFKMHIDTDDCRFLAEALEAIEKNTLIRVHVINGTKLLYPLGEMGKEVSAPYPILIAVLAVYTRVNPTVLAHFVFPMLLIPLAYLVMYLLSTYFFEDGKKRVIFMFLLAFIILFSFESVYSWGYTLLTIIWQGRSISAVIMIPLLWYFLMRIYTEENAKVMYFAMFVVGMANADLSGMGAMIVPLIGGSFAAATVIRDRKLLKAALIIMCMIPIGLYVLVFNNQYL